MIVINNNTRFLPLCFRSLRTAQKLQLWFLHKPFFVFIFKLSLYNFIFGHPLWTQISLLIKQLFPPTNWFIELSRSLEGKKHFLFFIPVEIRYRFCTCTAPKYHHPPVGSLPASERKCEVILSHRKSSADTQWKLNRCCPLRVFSSICLVEKKTILLYKIKPDWVRSPLLTKKISAFVWYCITQSLSHYNQSVISTLSRPTGYNNSIQTQLLWQASINNSVIFSTIIMKIGQILVTGVICVWEVPSTVCLCHIERGAQPPGRDSWHKNNRGSFRHKGLCN